LFRWRACVIGYEGSCVGLGLIKIRDYLGTRIRALSLILLKSLIYIGLLIILY
jgi:hypothetical protein